MLIVEKNVAVALVTMAKTAAAISRTNFKKLYALPHAKVAGDVGHELILRHGMEERQGELPLFSFFTGADCSVVA